jgi:hypothetical protein
LKSNPTHSVIDLRLENFVNHWPVEVVTLGLRVDFPMILADQQLTPNDPLININIINLTAIVIQL